MRPGALPSAYTLSAAFHGAGLALASWLTGAVPLSPVAAVPVELIRVAEVRPAAAVVPPPRPAPPPKKVKPPAREPKVGEVTPPKLVARPEPEPPAPPQVQAAPEPAKPAPADPAPPPGPLAESSGKPAATPAAPVKTEGPPEPPSGGAGRPEGAAPAEGGGGFSPAFQGGDTALLAGPGIGGARGTGPGGGGPGGGRGPGPGGPADGSAASGTGGGSLGSATGGAESGDGVAGLARPLGGYQVRPRYPDAARRAGAEGTTVLKVRVLADGSVGEVIVERSAGHPDLDRAAVGAVKRWRFEPARRGAIAVPVWVIVPVKFTFTLS